MNTTSSAGPRARGLSASLLTFTATAALLLGTPSAWSQTLYVGSYNNPTVDKIDSTGAVSLFATLPTGSNPIYGLAFDSGGTLYTTACAYANQNNNMINKITPGGAVSTFLALPYGSNPLGLAFDGSGNLYVAINGNPTNNTIDKITPAGAVSTFATLGSSYNPVGLAFDTGGNLYVSGNNGNYSNSTIDKIAPGGAVSTFAHMPGSSGPGGLAFDSSGNLFVADAFDLVRKITPGGTVSTFATLSTSAIGMAIDGNNNLYVSEQTAGQIIQITPAGAMSTFATGLSQPDLLVLAPTPEPGSATLAVLGGLGLLLRRRRERVVRA